MFPLQSSEGSIKISGWITLCVGSDVDVSQSTVIKHGYIMGLTVTLVDLEGNNGSSIVLSATLGS